MTTDPHREWERALCITALTNPTLAAITAHNEAAVLDDDTQVAEWVGRWEQ